MVKYGIAVLIGCSSQFLIALAYRNSILTLGTLGRLTQNWQPKIDCCSQLKILCHIFHLICRQFFSFSVQKIILLHQNNYIENSSMINNATKKFLF